MLRLCGAAKVCSACCKGPIALVYYRPCPALDCASTCAGHTEANKQVKVSEDHDSSSGTKDNRSPEEKEPQETHDGHVSSSSARMCSAGVLPVCAACSLRRHASCC